MMPKKKLNRDTLFPRDGCAVDYTKRVTVPIRDMENDGRVVFAVDVYGVEPKDLCIIPGGSAPMYHAVERLGLDPNRYAATIWDLSQILSGGGGGGFDHRS